MPWLALLIVLVLLVPFLSRPAWLRILPWFHVLWACRISAFSVALGFLLMAFVPQARDLFAETEAGLARWAGFFLAMFFGWAFAVHYSARQVLTFDDWAVKRDLPDHVRAKLRRDLRQSYRWPIAYMPRILGLLCFVALFAGIWLQRRNFAEAGNRIELVRDASAQMDRLLVATVAAAAAFLVFVVARGAFVEGKPEMTWTDLRRSLLAAPRQIARTDPLWFRYWFKPAALRQRWQHSPHIVIEEAATLAYFALLLALLAAALGNPLWLSGAFARSMVLVAMLGAWVVPLSYVTIWSHHVRAPLLVLLVLGLSLASLVSSGFHDLRLADPPAAKGLDPADRQVTINEAIVQWRRANCSGENLEHCPSPIIVAGQGGASRAAYVLGTVVGRILDETHQDQEAYADAAKRIFALSTVSGGSLGAVVIRAALENALGQSAPGRAAAAPCQRSDPLWFRARDVEIPENWEDCLQTILAGDFLSPTFVGVAFRDHFSIDNPFTGLPLWGDRAMLLERSWEARFRAIVDAKRPVGAAKPPGLARPLGYLKRNVWPQEAGKGWLPLLFLNATSVNTGHRIIASDVKPYLCDASNSPNALYPQAYDVFELFSWNERAPPEAVTQFCGAGPIAADWSARAPDLRLSTAGAMSARFPVVSPAGRIAARRDGRTVVVDRVIDGGYFENDGLATGLDIAKVLQSQGLRPVVVRVTNDPIPRKPEDDDDPADPTDPAAPAEAALQEVRVASAAGDIEGAPGQGSGDLPPQGARLPRPGSDLSFPETGDPGIFEPLVSPLIGLYNTRQGHGSEAADAAARLVEDPLLMKRATIAKLEPSAFIQIRIRDSLGIEECGAKSVAAKPARIAEVSMSWWLSQPVQAYLDAQVCDRANRRSFDALMNHLRRETRADLLAERPEAH